MLYAISAMACDPRGTKRSREEQDWRQDVIVDAMQAYGAEMPQGVYEMLAEEGKAEEMRQALDTLIATKTTLELLDVLLAIEPVLSAFQIKHMLDFKGLQEAVAETKQLNEAVELKADIEAYWAAHPEELSEDPALLLEELGEVEEFIAEAQAVLEGIVIRTCNKRADREAETKPLVNRGLPFEVDLVHTPPAPRAPSAELITGQEPLSSEEHLRVVSSLSSSEERSRATTPCIATGSTTTSRVDLPLVAQAVRSSGLRPKAKALAGL